jgi:hypothetical protein
MQSLRDALAQCERDGVAIGHFNVSDWVLLKAVSASGQELGVLEPGFGRLNGLRQGMGMIGELRPWCAACERNAPVLKYMKRLPTCPRA